MNVNKSIFQTIETDDKDLVLLENRIKKFISVSSKICLIITVVVAILVVLIWKLMPLMVLLGSWLGFTLVKVTANVFVTTVKASMILPIKYILLMSLKFIVIIIAAFAVVMYGDTSQFFQLLTGIVVSQLAILCGSIYALKELPKK